MTIANRLKHYLDDTGVAYDIVSHPRTVNSSESAQAAHVSGERVVKSVLIHHDQGYVLVVIPSTHRIEFATLQELLQTRLGLATEGEVGEVFEDCNLGAVPPVGAAYGLTVMLDDSLADAPDVYFEGGDHRSLVHVTGQDFGSLLKDARRARFSHHV